jgi:hypothetical protein
MPLPEALRIINKGYELRDQGKSEEADRLFKQVPLEPWMAKWAKDHLGADFLIQSGWNLVDAEAEFGPGWLTQ